jgi:hypothetical protein
MGEDQGVRSGGICPTRNRGKDVTLHPIPEFSSQVTQDQRSGPRLLLTSDSRIRATMRATLAAVYDGDASTLIIEEFGLGHGAARVDIVVVNSSLHGSEIKSDRDTLRRLPRRVRIFGPVLDYITLVVGQRHRERATRAVPDWWGLKLACTSAEGRIHLSEAREPRANPSPDKVAIARLLWRDEALGFLNELGAARGLLSKPRKMLYARLADVVDLDPLRARVRSQLTSRTD